MWIGTYLLFLLLDKEVPSAEEMYFMLLDKDIHIDG